MRFLRQNTAVRITVGPFLDKTDGVTPETALTVTNCKLTFMVDDDDNTATNLIIDAAATASGGNNDMVHVTNDDAGFYDLELTAAQTNYLGRAMLAVTDAANHCPVFHEFMIVSQGVYDKLFGAYSTTRGLAGTALPDAAADAAGGLAISDAGGLDLDAKLAATNEVTAARMGALTDWINGGRLDLLIDAIKAKTDALNFTGADVKATLDGEEVTPATASKTGYALTAAYDPAKTAATQASVDVIDGIVDTIIARVVGTLAAGTHNPQSGDAYARLGAPAGASHAADVAAVKAETAAILDDTGTSGVVVASASKTGYSLVADYDAAKTAAPASTALSSAVWTATKAGYLDAAITSRHASGAAVAKSPATLAAADVTGNLPADVKAWNAGALPTIGTSTITTSDIDARLAAWGKTGFSLAGTVTTLDGAITALATAHGAGSWATATGFSTHSASDVVTAMGTGSTLTALATAANLSTANAVLAKLDTTLVLDGAVYDFTAAALAAAPTSGGGSGLDAAGVRAAIGLSSANLDAQLAALLGYVDCLPAAWVVPAAAGSAMALTAGERGTLAEAILDLPNGIETGVTVRQATQRMAAVIAGKASGAGTGSETFVGLDGATTRIVATVDEDGNRTAMVAT